MTPDFREQALREMGLAPLWVRRGVAGVSGASGERAAEAALPAGLPAALASAEVAARVAPGSMQPVGPAVILPTERAATIARLPWAELADCVAQCTACPLGLTRRQTVFGTGVPDAPWLLVGEAPGQEEDASGAPFVGASGRLLDNMLRAAGLSREHEIYLTNTVKCHPPASRRPESAEVEQCAPHLRRQIALIRTRLILALGAVAAQSLLDTDEPVGSLRGKVHLQRFGEREIPVIVTFHPAYVLRKLSEKSSSWADLCLARETMRKLVSASA